MAINGKSKGTVKTLTTSTTTTEANFRTGVDDIIDEVDKDILGSKLDTDTAGNGKGKRTVQSESTALPSSPTNGDIVYGF